MGLQQRHIDSWRFPRKWLLWGNGEFSKIRSKLWQKLKRGDEEGNLDK